MLGNFLPIFVSDPLVFQEVRLRERFTCASSWVVLVATCKNCKTQSVQYMYKFQYQYRTARHNEWRAIQYSENCILTLAVSFSEGNTIPTTRRGGNAILATCLEGIQCSSLALRKSYTDYFPHRYVATCMVPVEVKVRQAGGNLLGSKHQGHNVSRSIILLLL